MHVYNPVPEGYEPLNIAGATRQRGPVREQMYAPRDMAYALNQFKDLGLKRSKGLGGDLMNYYNKGPWS
jgi:hypothetical protein